MNSNEQRVVIIGGGVCGLSTAYYCLKAGLKPIVLDPRPGSDEGCSYGNAGMIVPSHFVPLAAPGIVWQGLKWSLDPESPFSVKVKPSPALAKWGLLFMKHANQKHVEESCEIIRDLNLESRRLFEELSNEIGDFGLVRKGLLMLCKTEHGLEEEGHVAKRANELGIPAEILNKTQLDAMEPGVDMDVAGAVFFPKDCHLEPGRFMQALTVAVRAGGGEIHSGFVVDEFLFQSGKVSGVKTECGQVFEGSHFVLAAGAESQRLAKKIKVTLPIQPGKGYSMTLPNPPQLPKLCSILTEARVAVTPMGDSLRIAGTMEIGAELGHVNEAKIRGVIRSAQAYYPALTEKSFKDVPIWEGLRPCSPDGLPYIGTVKQQPHVAIVSGHAMMGLSLGPISGQLATQALLGTQPTLPLGQLNPMRFS